MRHLRQSHTFEITDPTGNEVAEAGNIIVRHMIVPDAAITAVLSELHVKNERDGCDGHVFIVGPMQQDVHALESKTALLLESETPRLLKIWLLMRLYG